MVWASVAVYAFVARNEEVVLCVSFLLLLVRSTVLFFAHFQISHLSFIAMAEHHATTLNIIPIEIFNFPFFVSVLVRLSPLALHSIPPDSHFHFWSKRVEKQKEKSRIKRTSVNSDTNWLRNFVWCTFPPLNGNFSFWVVVVVASSSSFWFFFSYLAGMQKHLPKLENDLHTIQKENALHFSCCHQKMCSGEMVNIFVLFLSHCFDLLALQKLGLPSAFCSSIIQLLLLGRYFFEWKLQPSWELIKVGSCSGVSTEQSRSGRLGYETTAHSKKGFVVKSAKTFIKNC